MATKKKVTKKSTKKAVKKSKLLMESRRYQLTLVSPMLGSAVDSHAERAVFYSDEEGICLFSFHVKDMLRHNAEFCTLPIKDLRKKITNFVSVGPHKIRVFGYGRQITKPDGIYERPVRLLEFKNGPRTALIRADQINPERTMEIVITIVSNNSGINFQVVERLLSLGRGFGLSGWRRHGFGQFMWTLLDTVKESKHNG